jgi:hypothetical protein
MNIEAAFCQNHEYKSFYQRTSQVERALPQYVRLLICIIIIAISKAIENKETNCCYIIVSWVGVYCHNASDKKILCLKNILKEYDVIQISTKHHFRIYIIEIKELELQYTLIMTTSLDFLTKPIDSKGINNVLWNSN